MNHNVQQTGVAEAVTSDNSWLSRKQNDCLYFIYLSVQSIEHEIRDGKASCAADISTKKTKQ
jgi:hypothetical protein